MMPLQSRHLYRTVFLIIALIPVGTLSAFEFEIGGSALMLDGILSGAYTDTIVKNYSGVDAASISQVFSPLVGLGLSANLYVTPVLGASLDLSVHSEGGAVAVKNSDGTIVAGSSLEEINITLALRFLQRIRLSTGLLFFSEGLTIGLVPSEIVHVQTVGTSTTRTAVMPLEYYYAADSSRAGSADYALLAYGLELRAGYGYPVGPGTLAGMFVFRFARIPTGFSPMSGDAFISAPGLELCYTIQVGRYNAEK